VAWIRDTGARTLFSFLLLGLTAVLFVLSMFDFLQTLFAQNPNLFMKLPRSAVERIHSRIRGAFPRGRFGEPSGFGIAAAAALTGAAVSSVELVCTGQIYLPVLKVIVQENAGLVRTRALLYLALYNAAFVLPLSALLVFYAGAGASGVTARLKAHAVFSRAAICLALAGLFALQVAYL
jgi:hypothetical protein